VRPAESYRARADAARWRAGAFANILYRLAGIQISVSVQVSYVQDVKDYDPLAPVPRYRQIANIIRRRIESGELQPERPIPSEAQIMQEFGVARATARHAAELLRDEGLVVKVPGLGTFVRKPEDWHTSR
jgi:GntR family transcriptional regulator